MTTIITRTLPATDTKPTRITARFGDVGWGNKTTTVAFDHGADWKDNHLNAARMLWFEWSGDLDADYVGAGDLHTTRERVHLLRAYRGKGGFVTLPIETP